MADLVVTAASVLYTSGGEKLTGVAGASITAGQAVYVDTADANKVKLAQCDGTALEATAAGIALNAAGTGQTVTYAGQGALINIGATTAKTTTYLVAATAGGVAPQADITGGQRITRLGYATATDGTFKVDIAVTGATV
jgi:hypothetical protein